MNIFARLAAKRHDTGLRRYTKNLGWMFFARIGTMAIGLLATAYIARNLGPTSYGELSYAISFVMLVGMFASLGIDQTISRELILFPEKRNAVMGTALSIRPCGGGLFFFFFFFFLVPFFLSRVCFFWGKKKKKKHKTNPPPPKAPWKVLCPLRR